MKMKKKKINSAYRRLCQPSRENNNLQKKKIIYQLDCAHFSLLAYTFPLFTVYFVETLQFNHSKKEQNIHSIVIKWQ